MAGRYQKRRIKKSYYKRLSIAICATLAVLLAVVLAVWGVSSLITAKPDKDASSTISNVSSEPEVPHKVASATVVNTGDLLIHSPVLNGAKQTDGSYDFSDMFTPVASYFKDADLAVANLEVTLGGTESGKFTGYPTFNTPDSLIDGVKNAGIDLLLTANNHSYDTRLFGLKRTVSVLKQKGIDHLGTREAADDPHFTVKNVNGINIGMACFTYENATSTPGRKSINGNLMAEEANPLLSSFSYGKIDEFYAEATAMISDMKAQNADCVVFYMHWGEEYQTKPNNWQKTIAQKLCDLGVDIIVGGHPHVIQPIELLTSADGTHNTVCVYSLGNALSNQRKEVMTSCKTGHTEDGMLFYYTFDKYSDGKVVLSSVDIVPTWVNKFPSGGVNKYKIYPLENDADAVSALGLNTATANNAKASYKRTAALIGDGLTRCQSFFDCEVRFVIAEPVSSVTP